MAPVVKLTCTITQGEDFLLLIGIVSLYILWYLSTLTYIHFYTTCVIPGLSVFYIWLLNRENTKMLWNSEFDGILAYVSLPGVHGIYHNTWKSNARSEIFIVLRLLSDYFFLCRKKNKPFVNQLMLNMIWNLWWRSLFSKRKPKVCILCTDNRTMKNLGSRDMVLLSSYKNVHFALPPLFKLCGQCWPYHWYWFIIVNTTV